MGWRESLDDDMQRQESQWRWLRDQKRERKGWTSADSNALCRSGLRAGRNNDKRHNTAVPRTDGRTPTFVWAAPLIIIVWINGDGSQRRSDYNTTERAARAWTRTKYEGRAAA